MMHKALHTRDNIDNVSRKEGVRELPSIEVSFDSSVSLEYYTKKSKEKLTTATRKNTNHKQYKNWITMDRKSGEHLCMTYGNTGQLFWSY